MFLMEFIYFFLFGNLDKLLMLQLQWKCYVHQLLCCRQSIKLKQSLLFQFYSLSMECLTPFQCGYSIFGKYRDSRDYQLDILLRELSRAVHISSFNTCRRRGSWEGSALDSAGIEVSVRVIVYFFPWVSHLTPFRTLVMRMAKSLLTQKWCKEERNFESSEVTWYQPSNYDRSTHRTHLPSAIMICHG